VGTRNATDYGREICEELIESFSKTDIQVVSGMAYGIDICAHSACLKNNIQTVGVLGHGLDRIYPSIHRRIAEGMLENGGLLSEFLPGTKPDKENFPMRNRIVAGMSDATIVIESKVSGGSLITADLAFDYNKDVFAFPGNVGQTYSAGCNLLIQKNKAHLITNGSDFLNFMGWQSAGGVNQKAQITVLQELTEEEKRVIECLDSSALHIDLLALNLKMPISRISVILLTMELKGLIRSLPGNKYGVV
jgi:DNA processing protein